MAASFVHGQPRVAKVVDTGEIAFDTARMEPRVEEAVLRVTEEAVSGMNYLQISRDRGTVSLSLQYAISHLRNSLDAPEVVSTPPPDNINWFYHQSMHQFLQATDYLEPVIQEDDDGSKHFFVHPAFRQFREREVSVWLVRIGPYTWKGVPDDLRAHWGVIVAATRPLEKPVFVPRGQAVEGIPGVDNNRDRYFDRVVADVQLFDPLNYGNTMRLGQRGRILTYFSLMCRRAATLLRPKTFRAGPAHPMVNATWKTGYLCYAIVKEFLRRLDVASAAGFTVEGIGRQDQDAYQGLSGAEFWDNVMRANYTGLEHLDACRNSMMTGCAARAVQMSEYRARLAVELPGKGTGHKPDRLDPVKGPKVDVPHPSDPEQKLGRLMIEIYSSNAAG